MSRVDVAAVVEHVDRLQHRIIRDAVLEATTSYWLRRAAAFEAATPRPGDYSGQATRAELETRREALEEAAQACRAAAGLALLPDEEVGR